MADYSLRREPGLVAGKSGAPSEIDILEEGEVGRIETAELEEEIPPEHERPGAAEQDRPLGKGPPARRGADLVLQGVTGEVRIGANEIDALPVPAHDSARGGRRTGVACGRGMQGRKPIGPNACVVVQKDDPACPTDRRRPVVGAGEAQIGLVLDDPDPREAGSHESYRVVR